MYITMEGTVRPRSCNPSSSPPSKLGMQRDSHVISKLIKPKVRIIHIVAPEIIKTDVANFRELVQRLTGQPCESKGLIKKKARSTSTTPAKKRKTTGYSCESNKKAMQQIPEFGLASLIRGEKQVGANKMWEGENSLSNCNFLDGFGDLNGFMNDLSDSFSLTTSNSQSSCEMDGYEDIYTPFLAKGGLI